MEELSIEEVDALLSLKWDLDLVLRIEELLNSKHLSLRLVLCGDKDYGGLQVCP